MAPDLKSKKRKAAVADDEVEVQKKEKKVNVDVPAKKRKTVENGTSEITKKSKAAKTAPVAESPKPVVAKKTAAVIKPVVADKTEEKKSKKTKADKPLSENRKKLKEMKDAPDAEAKALKEKKAKSDKSAKEPVEIEVEEDSDVEMDDQTEALLKGFESASDDEKDPEDQEYEGEPIPELTKKAKNKLAKLAAKKEASSGPGTVYLGRIPHGFYEHEMRQYFKQFGDIAQLRLSRNRKTGKSKHYAFIQFASADVASIVSKTMDNYLLFGHILKCKIVPEEQIHAGLWEGANKRFKKVPWNKMEGRKLNMGLDEAGWDKRNERETKRREEKAEKMKALGYEFEAPKLKSAKGIPKRPRGPLVVAAEPVDAEVEEPKVEEPKVEEPVVVVKESKRKAETAETEEPSKKKQKKLKAKASSDKLAVEAEAAKPAAKPVAERKSTRVKKTLEEKTEKAADKPVKKAKKSKA